MSLILSLIPKEIIENYSVSVNAESPITNKKSFKIHRKQHTGRPRRGQSAVKSAEASSASEQEDDVAESEGEEDDQPQSSDHSNDTEEGEKES